MIPQRPRRPQPAKSRWTCEPEPEPEAAGEPETPPLLDLEGQPAEAAWQAFAARWVAADSNTERQCLRGATLDGCRRQLERCLQADGSLDVCGAAALIQEHEAAASAALAATHASASDAEALRLARSHGWELSLQASSLSAAGLLSCVWSSGSSSEPIEGGVQVWGKCPRNPHTTP